MSNKKSNHVSSRTTEAAVNMILASVLRSKLLTIVPDAYVRAESTGIFESPNDCPDIIICTERAAVVVETEFDPALNVEEEALGRFIKKYNSSYGGKKVQNVIAMKLPEDLAYANQDELEDLIENCELKFCWYPNSSSRLPERGWDSSNIAQFTIFVAGIIDIIPKYT